MSPTELRILVAQRGIEVWRVGDKLRYRPKELLTPDLAALLQEHKPQLLAKLADSVRIGASAAAAGDEKKEPAAPSSVRQQPPQENWPSAGWPDAETISIDEVPLCPRCDVIDHWRDGLGNWHCRRCSPSKWNGTSLRKLAQRLSKASARRRTKKNNRANSC